MNPRFPIYVVSKGRWESRTTVRHLEAMSVPYRIVIEEQEFDAYASVIDAKNILVLDKKFQDDYDTFDTLGDTITRGSGPARNFVWEHSIARGDKWHWIVDDNIRGFGRLHKNKHLVRDGVFFRCMEDFVLRYSNVGLAGPDYEFFPRSNIHPFILNHRIYSCILIRNDIGFRWRCRYNEDTDLSLRVLKAGWCTILFCGFLQYKAATLSTKGGNTTELYADGERKLDKSRMIVAAHPDVTHLKRKWNRWHHVVNYSVFKQRLILRKGVKVKRGINNYGMRLVSSNQAPQVKPGGRPQLNTAPASK
jgi:hypothetical protein